MKRDLDLVREILLVIEASDPDDSAALVAALSAGASADIVLRHLKMLIEEVGLVSAIDASSMDGMAWLEPRLTWDGHEYLDAVRDPEIWKLTKTGAEKAGGFTLDIVAALAKGFIKKRIEDLTGVTLEL